MKPMTSTGIQRAIRAAIDGNYLAPEVAARLAEALDDAAFHMALEADERGDRLALMRAERLQDLSLAIEAGCAEVAPVVP